MSMTVDPNLNAEVYRNTRKKINGDNKTHRIDDVLEICDDNTTLLCSNDLVGRNQNSFLSLHKSPNNLLENRPFTTLEEDTTTSAAEFLRSDLIMVGEDSGMLKLCTTQSYDGKNNKLITVSKTAAHEDVITSIVKLTKSNNCITASRDLEIKVWDTNYLEDQFVTLHTFYPAHRGAITDLTINPTDSNVFCSCSDDRASFLWDLRKKTPATGLFKSEHALKCTAWQTISTIVAFGDCDGTLMLVDVRCPGTVFKKVQAFQTEFHRVQFSPKSPNLLAMCADSSIVKVIDVDKDNLNCTVYEENLHTDIIRGLAWDRLLTTLYTCGYDNKIISHNIK